MEADLEIVQDDIKTLKWNKDSMDKKEYRKQLKELYKQRSKLEQGIKLLHQKLGN